MHAKRLRMFVNKHVSLCDLDIGYRMFWLWVCLKRQEDSWECARTTGTVFPRVGPGLAGLVVPFLLISSNSLSRLFLICSGQSVSISAEEDVDDSPGSDSSQNLFNFSLCPIAVKPRSR